MRFLVGNLVRLVLQIGLLWYYSCNMAFLLLLIVIPDKRHFFGGERGTVSEPTNTIDRGTCQEHD